MQFPISKDLLQRRRFICLISLCCTIRLIHCNQLMDLLNDIKHLSIMKPYARFLISNGHQLVKVFEAGSCKQSVSIRSISDLSVNAQLTKIILAIQLSTTPSIYKKKKEKSLHLDVHNATLLIYPLVTCQQTNITVFSPSLYAVHVPPL